MSYVTDIAKYYSDFLSTDFKKGTLPKRRFSIKDTKGRRIGIPSNKFPTVVPKLKNILNTTFDEIKPFKIKQNEYTANLRPVTKQLIKAQIEKLSLDNLYMLNKESIEKLKNKVKENDSDKELALEAFAEEVRNNVGLEVAALLIIEIQQIFEEHAVNQVEELIAFDEGIIDLLVDSFEEKLPTALARLITENDESLFEELFEELFRSTNVKEKLIDYFNDFSAGDLYTDLRDLDTIKGTDETLEYYLYLGEVIYKVNKKNHKFPLFYMPITATRSGNSFELNLEPRMLLNKKAIDYIGANLQQVTNTRRALKIKDRIHYLSENQTVFSVVNKLLQDIMDHFDITDNISFGSQNNKVKNSSILVSTDLSIALFDKSDESMLTDYEELLNNDEDKGNLLGHLTKLIESFLSENPESIEDEIENNWEETSIPERLVTAQPLPLAEEQRQILNALKNDRARFITVEGPPGTGKSHTISAIAFNAILEHKTILILSDKKEALDVVENKLNETLSKIRPSEDFINPILRLGRTASNLTKLTSRSAIDELKHMRREFKKSNIAAQEQYREVVDRLTKNITDEMNRKEDIDLSEVINFETKLKEFREIYGANVLNKVQDFFEVENSQEVDSIKNLVNIENLYQKLSEKLRKFVENSFPNSLSDIIQGLGFCNTIENLGGDKIFKELPKLDNTNRNMITKFKQQLIQAKGIFGYLFSGKKVELIKSEMQSVLGYRSSEAPATMINKLGSLTHQVDSLYDTIKKEFGEDYLNIIPDASSLEAKVINYKELDGFLTTLEENLDEIDTDFLKDEMELVSVIRGVTSSDSKFNLEFFSTFLELREQKQKLNAVFNFEDYNYLGNKTAIENYQALALAAELDNRVIQFAQDNRNDVKSINDVIKQKKKFPKDQFEQLRESFPCMICGLRDYAEYIPLEPEIFDIVIIDEASQVSIAQALPAILRAKKMIVLGDRKQFGNVKTSTASKELNTSYFTEAIKEIPTQINGKSIQEVQTQTFNISNSILDFMERMSNFQIMLKKHFRGYPEMISFSSKWFYQGKLQAMKIRGSNIDNVLEFVELPHDGKFDQFNNTNELEAEEILKRIVEQLDTGDERSVAVITPFRDQMILIQRKISNHERYSEINEKLKFRCFTFDSCQGEERDIIYYSFVANENRDNLWAIFPKSIKEADDDDLDHNLKMQRLNVGFSRGKEKLVFIHSKPIEELKSSLREALNHYRSVITKAKDLPSEDDVDPSSEAEKKVLGWLSASSFYQKYQPEILPQFKIGEYLKTIDRNYSHPNYRLDFLLRFEIEADEERKTKARKAIIIIEYDGFENHFENTDGLNAGNWEHYQKESDIERDRILESFGYKTLRINKFNVGKDPIETIDNRVMELLDDLWGEAGYITENKIVQKIRKNVGDAIDGIRNNTMKTCKKCDTTRPLESFIDNSTVRGYGYICNECKQTSPGTRSKKRKKNRKGTGRKQCPNCRKSFPNSEFNDPSNKSGRRRLCGSCKHISDIKQAENALRYGYGRGY